MLNDGPRILEDSEVLEKNEKDWHGYSMFHDSDARDAFYSTNPVAQKKSA